MLSQNSNSTEFSVPFTEPHTFGRPRPRGFTWFNDLPAPRNTSPLTRVGSKWCNFWPPPYGIQMLVRSQRPENICFVYPKIVISNSITVSKRENFWKPPLGFAWVLWHAVLGRAPLIVVTIVILPSIIPVRVLGTTFPASHAVILF